MRHFAKSVLLLFGLLSLWCSNSYALKQYRCDGLVQYRPCDDATYSDSLQRSDSLRRSIISFSHRSVRAQVRRQGYARVSQETFSRESQSRGVWRGRVEGNGTIHLHLHLIVNGKQETRYMGNVSLPNKSTSFRFESSIPSSAHWTWQITAQTA